MNTLINIGRATTCYISSLSKIKERYAGWETTKNLTAVFREILEFSQKRPQFTE
jgi:hypothetical protein